MLMFYGPEDFCMPEFTAALRSLPALRSLRARMTGLRLSHAAEPLAAVGLLVAEMPALRHAASRGLYICVL